MIHGSRFLYGDIVLVDGKLECGYAEGDGRANDLLTIEFLESTLNSHDAKDGTRDGGGRTLAYMIKDYTLPSRNQTSISSQN